MGAPPMRVDKLGVGIMECGRASYRLGIGQRGSSAAALQSLRHVHTRYIRLAWHGRPAHDALALIPHGWIVISLLAFRGRWVYKLGAIIAHHRHRACLQRVTTICINDGGIINWV